MEHGGYLIEMDGFGLRHIRPKGRGTVPKPLRGKFTKAGLAQEAIDKYNSSKEAKNAKTEGTGEL